MTLPDELVEAARRDVTRRRARFSATSCCRCQKPTAAFVITFIYGWNQYLWPLLIITDVNLSTAVAGIKKG